MEEGLASIRLSISYGLSRTLRIGIPMSAAIHPTYLSMLPDPAPSFEGPMRRAMARLRERSKMMDGDIAVLPGRKAWDRAAFVHDDHMRQFRGIAAVAAVLGIPSAVFVVAYGSVPSISDGGLIIWSSIGLVIFATLIRMAARRAGPLMDHAWLIEKDRLVIRDHRGETGVPYDRIDHVRVRNDAMEILDSKRRLIAAIPSPVAFDGRLVDGGVPAIVEIIRNRRSSSVGDLSSQSSLEKNAGATVSLSEAPTSLSAA